VRALLYSAGKTSQNGAKFSRPPLVGQFLKSQMLLSDRFGGADLAPADFR
jgi:hypothetical protein